MSAHMPSDLGVGVGGLTRERRRAERLRHHTEDQGALIDDKLGPSQVVVAIPHVTALKLRPLYLLQIKAPYHRCHPDFKLWRTLQR